MAASALGAISRTRPASATSGWVHNRTSTRPAFLSSPMRLSGTAISTSRSPSRASFMTTAESFTTCPTSAPTAVMTPGWSASKLV